MASPRYIPMKGSLPFRVVLREWRTNTDGEAIEWVVHTEFINEGDRTPSYAYGHYTRDFGQAQVIFKDVTDRKRADHNAVRQARQITDFRNKVRVLREQWEDMGMKIASVIEEIEYNEETSVTPEMYQDMKTLDEYYKLWNETVKRYMAQ
jgi:hypothetical protein